MRSLIYQVYVGKKSRLYDRCIESVKSYCDKHKIDHIVQREPILKIKPDVFNTGRSTESYEKHGGFLPIFEKENAFDYVDQYDNIAIIDADVWIRPGSDNVFDEFFGHFGAVCERDMPIHDWYKKKIANYSHMQYSQLHKKVDFKPNNLGFEFFNMGVMLLKTKGIKPHLKGQTAREFINRPEFKDFVDGVGPWKWSTDQTLLNYWIKKENIDVQPMHWKWNGLYTANERIKECNFVHFFLKDKLPNRGEDIEKLIEDIL